MPGCAENDSEVEMERFGVASDPSRPTTSSASSWLDSNPHDGSSRRLRYFLGFCFLVVMVCSSILYSSHKRTVRGDIAMSNDAASEEATSRTSSATDQQAPATAINSNSKSSHGLTVQDIRNQRTSEMRLDRGRNVVSVTPRALEQIHNFRLQQKGLLLNIHITHHAGTAMCGALGRAPGLKGAPSFACNGVKPDENATLHDYFEQHKRPWSSQDTDANIQLFSTFYHMLSWEFSKAPSPRPLSATNWEHPQLVSIIVMRDPLSRLLAGDHATKTNFPNILEGNASLDEWWAFADSTNTNNFAMRILAGQDCCQGQDTEPIHLVHAKELLSRFTFILDLACLTDGMAAVAHSLGFEPRQQRALLDQAAEMMQRELAPSGVVHPPVSERIPFPQVYEFLQRRNYLDIELYEWSKQISLVRCEA